MLLVKLPPKRLRVVPSAGSVELVAVALGNWRRW